MALPLILPERLHLFGMSSLAPVYWQLFQQLGRHMAVHCFQLSPCRGFWHDLKPKWRQAREQEADTLLAMEALPKEPKRILKIEKEIQKTREKITEQQNKLKELEVQKTEAENLEIVQMVRSLHMTPAELSVFLAKGVIPDNESVTENEYMEDMENEE